MISDYKIKNRQSKQKIFALFSGEIKLKIIFLAGLVITSLFFTQLVFANSLATGGQKLSEVQEEIKRLDRENMTLRADIASQSSLTNLVKKSEQLGFKKPLKITIL
ncbi:MAG: hypothetical protein AAB512_02295 [Patescibacteria group bacterium]